MSINDFFTEPKFKRFQKYQKDKTIIQLYEFLEDEETVKKMSAAIVDKKPALFSIVNDIENTYSDKLTLSGEGSSFVKQLIGSMISFILGEYGYENNGISKSLNNSKYFSVAACYKNIQRNPFDKTKQLKTIINKKFGTITPDQEWQHIYEFDDYIGNDKSQFTFRKAFQLLIKAENLDLFRKCLESNGHPVDLALEILCANFRNLNSQTSGTFLFDSAQGHVVLEELVKHILKSINYVYTGFTTTSKYFEQTWEYAKQNLSERASKKKSIDSSKLFSNDECCKCNKKLKPEAPFFYMNICVEDQSFIHENIRYPKLKLCIDCIKKLSPLNEFYNLIDIEELKKDSILVKSLSNSYYDDYFLNIDMLDEIRDTIANNMLNNNPELIDKYKKYLEKKKKETIENVEIAEQEFIEKQKKQNELFDKIKKETKNDRAALLKALLRDGSILSRLPYSIEKEYDIYTRICFYLGIIYKIIGNYELAIASLEEAQKYRSKVEGLKKLTNLSFDDKPVEKLSIIHNQLGLIYEITSKYEKALDEFNTAIKLNPSQHPDYYKNRGIIYQKIEDFEKAQKDFEKYKDLKEIKNKK